MDIKTVYEKFDKIGCLTFATVEKNRPRTRIAHLFAYDEEGLYFRTMTIKPFYIQLKKTGKVAICGMYPKTTVSHDENGMAYFEPGYSITATGDVKEISFETLKAKAAGNKMFQLGVKDIEKYPNMTTLCLHRGFGEVFDFDFDMQQRSHKLLRTGFSFGGMDIPFRGVRITEDCIACGECIAGCSFKAIYQEGEQYLVDNTKCDVCGDCSTVCPSGAIEVVNE